MNGPTVSGTLYRLMRNPMLRQRKQTAFPKASRIEPGQRKALEWELHVRQPNQ